MEFKKIIRIPNIRPISSRKVDSEHKKVVPGMEEEYRKMKDDTVYLEDKRFVLSHI